MSTQSIMKYIAIVVVVSVFAVSLNQWDSQSATVESYDDLQENLTYDDSFNSTFPTFPNIEPPPDNGGIIPDIPGAIIYIGTLIFSAIVFFLQILFWIISSLFSIVVSLFATATLTMDGFPPEIQQIIWVFSLPMFFLIIWSLLKLIRGTEG